MEEENQAMSGGEVGFVGLGLMGGAIATRLVTQGYDVSAYDVQEAQVEAVVSAGGQSAKSAAEAVRAITAICVPNGTIMKTILSDPAFENALKPGSILLDFSTVDPEDSRFAAKHVQAFGARYIDVPVGRTPGHAMRGELLAMAGSTESDASSFAGVLDAVASDVFFCGGIGLGSTMKLVNNLCNQTILFVTLEALNFARASGLSDELSFGVLTHTNADNGHLRNTVPDRAFTDNYEGGFKLSLAYKDLALAIGVANRAGAVLPTSAASLQAAAMAMTAGLSNYDSSVYFKWLSELSQ
jgi:4-hydroxybutyrate dehydrogenase/sulfolactaldehyde 3-reductase